MAATESSVTATVRRVRRNKQEELPGVDQSDRKIAELEQLGDELDDLQEEMKSLKGRVKEKDDELVSAMKRRSRTYYNRPTWGSITLKETSTSAKVKKFIVGSTEEDDQDDE